MARAMTSFNASHAATAVFVGTGRRRPHSPIDELRARVQDLHEERRHREHPGDDLVLNR
jgi:hypothetical protein